MTWLYNILMRLQINVQVNRLVQKLHSDRYPDLFKMEVDLDELYIFYSSLVADENQYVLVAEERREFAGYCWAEYSNREETPIKYSV